MKKVDWLSPELFEADLRATLGDQTWEIYDLLVHGYGKRQISKIMELPYLEIKTTVTKLRQFLLKNNYVIEVQQ